MSALFKESTSVGMPESTTRKRHFYAVSSDLFLLI